MPVTFYPRKEITDNRGNIQLVPDMDNPVTTSAAEMQDRSSRAEVPGQQEIDVIRLIVRYDLPDVGVYSICKYRDAWWDIISPPQYHQGERHHTKHLSMLIKRRPVDDARLRAGERNWHA